MFQIRNEEKAIRFLKKQLSSGEIELDIEQLQKEVNLFYEGIPPTSRTEYGKTKMIQVANYYKQHRLKEDLQVPEDSMYDGGIYLYEEAVNEFFTIYSKSNGSIIRCVPLATKGKVFEMSRLEFADKISESIIISIFGASKAKVGAECKLNEMKVKNTDLKSSTAYLYNEFIKRGLPSPAYMRLELDMLEAMVPAELINEYGNTTTGKLLACAEFYRQNEESFRERELLAYELIFELGNENGLKAGDRFISSKNSEKTEPNYMYAIDMPEEGEEEIVLIPICPPNYINKLRKKALKHVAVNVGATAALTVATTAEISVTAVGASALALEAGAVAVGASSTAVATTGAVAAAGATGAAVTTGAAAAAVTGLMVAGPALLTAASLGLIAHSYMSAGGLLNMQRTAINELKRASIIKMPRAEFENICGLDNQLVPINSKLAKMYSLTPANSKHRNI